VLAAPEKVMTTLKVFVTLFTESDKYTVTGTFTGPDEEVTPALYGLILITFG